MGEERYALSLLHRSILRVVFSWLRFPHLGGFCLGDGGMSAKKQPRLEHTHRNPGAVPPGYRYLYKYWRRGHAGQSEVGTCIHHLDCVD